MNELFRSVVGMRARNLARNEETDGRTDGESLLLLAENIPTTFAPFFGP